jgi:hypothetical protein
MANGREALGDDGYVRVGAFRRGGTYFLVWTAGTIVCNARLFGFGTGTVFYIALVSIAWGLAV